MSSEYHRMDTPKANPPISVNIDDWFAARAVEKVVASVPEEIINREMTPEQREAFRVRRQKMADEMTRQQEIAARADKLDAKARECTECDSVEAHYHDDYMCFRCRDKLDND